jgi:hypothetical protein
VSLLSTPVGWFNRANAWFFGSTRRANFWYPIGKAFRNLTLKVLGISYIDNLGASTRR